MESVEIRLLERIRLELQGKSLSLMKDFRNRYSYYNKSLKWPDTDLIPDEELIQLLSAVQFEIQKSTNAENVGYFKTRDQLILKYNCIRDTALIDLVSKLFQIESTLHSMNNLSAKLIELKNSLSSAKDRLGKFLDHRDSHSDESIEFLRDKIQKIESEIASISLMDFQKLKIRDIDGIDMSKGEFGKIIESLIDVEIIHGKPHLSKSKFATISLVVFVILFFTGLYYKKRVDASKLVNEIKLNEFMNEMKTSKLFEIAFTDKGKAEFSQIVNYEEAFNRSDDLIAGNRDFMTRIVRTLVGACTISFNTKTGEISNNPDMNRVIKLEKLVGVDIEVKTLANVDGKNIDMGSCYIAPSVKSAKKKVSATQLCGGIDDILFQLHVSVGKKIFKFEVGTMDDKTTRLLDSNISNSVHCKRIM